MVSGLALGGLTVKLSLGLFVDGSVDVGSNKGDGVSMVPVELGVGARLSPPAPFIPFSVAILYFRIFALDIREVKWNTET